MKETDFKKTLQIAMELGVMFHHGQSWGVLPYSVHLYEVWKTLIEFGFSDVTKEMHQNLQIAAWLHDSIEDSSVNPEQLINNFGKKIFKIIWAVTDADGKNRAERKRATYPKLIKNESAITLKMADRLTNIRYSKIMENTKKFKMYQKEHEEFKNVLSKAERVDFRANTMLFEQGKLLGEI